MALDQVLTRKLREALRDAWIAKVDYDTSVVFTRMDGHDRQPEETLATVSVSEIEQEIDRRDYESISYTFSGKVVSYS